MKIVTFITLNLKINILSFIISIISIIMRKLLNNKSSASAFASLKQMIKKKSTQVSQFDRLQGIRFQKQMREMILRQQKQKQAIHQINKRYEKVCLTAARPIQTLLKEFLSHSKQYNEGDLVETAVALGKAYQMSLTDHGGKLDRFDYKLFESPMFDHFIEQVKYALSDKAYIQNKNIAKVLNALSNMNYLDMEIINLTLKKIQTIIMLPYKEKTDFKPRAYQIQKNGYYKSNIIGLDKTILRSQIFTKNLAYFEEKKKQFSTKQNTKSISQTDFKSVQNFQIVMNLLNVFQKFNKGVDDVIEGVIAIRRQYCKMVTISKNQKVMRNPELNYNLLLIEEKLLQMHLITIQDVRNPQAILKQDKQNEKVEQIVKILMSEMQVDNFEDFLTTQKKNLEYLKTKRQNQLYDISKLFSQLAKYASLSNKLYGTGDKVTLLSTKWQRYFLEDKFEQHNIQVERLFRKAFVRVHAFFSRHLPIIEFALIQSNLKSKIHWYSTLIEMGYYDDLAAQFKGMKINKQSLSDLSTQEFVLFVKALNNLFQTDFRLSDPTSNYIEQRLSTIIQQQPEALNIHALCDSINYLYQINSVKKTNQDLYKKLISLLSQEVTYLVEYKRCSSSVTKQAKRILFFEDLIESQYQGSLQHLKEIENIGNQKSNPYLKLLYDTFNPTKAPLSTPYITTGINQNNQLTGLYFANFDNSATVGNLVSGHTNAYCMRIYNKFGIKVTALPITKFIDVNLPAKLNSQSYFKNVSIAMKSSQQILAAIAQYLPRNSQVLVDFIKNTGNLLNIIAQDPGAQIKIRKIISSLKRIAALFNQQKNILLLNQFLSKRSILLVQLHLLKRDFNLLSKQQTQKIKKATKQSENNFETLLTQAIKQIEKPLISMQKVLKESSQKNKNSKIENFKGKRTTINTISAGQQKNTQKASIEEESYLEFLNIPNLLDFRYVEYEDWRKKLKESVNYNEIKLSQASDITKILVAKFCPNIKQTLVTVPSIKRQFIVPFYPLNWENKYYYHPQNVQENNRLQQIADGYREAYKNSKFGCKEILAIQNFKLQLKMTLTPKKILQRILNLQFINDLLLNRIQDKKESEVKNAGDFIKRDPKQYFTYLQRKADKMYLQSPYLQYIFNKIQQTQRLKQKIQQRKDSKIKLGLLFSQGVINKKQYFENVKQLDEKLIDDMKILKKKIVAHVDGIQILDEGSKIIQLNKNIEDLEKVVRGAYYYDHQEDSDFVLAGGNYEKALNYKRYKAQNNLILFRILYQLSKNQKLNQNQTKFLENWKKQTIEGVDQYKNSQNFTKMRFQNLSETDRQKLTLYNTNFGKQCPTLAVNDIILEMSNFLDESLIHKMQAQVYAEHFSKKLNVPVSVFASSSNKLLKVYNNKIQQMIFQNNARLNKTQLDCLIEMSRIFKTQGLSDREKYEKHYKNIRQNLQHLNYCKFRNPLIAEYLKQKDYQYYHSYYPEDVQQLKVEKVMSLWIQIFEKSPLSTTFADILIKVNEICERMLMIKMNVPPYFGNLVIQILRHEKADIYTKQKLIAYIELFKVPLQLDSLDLMKLVKIQKSQSHQLMESINRVNNQNFVKAIYAYL